MSKPEYLIWQCDTSLHLVTLTSLTTLLAIIKQMSIAKSVVVKDIDIVIADILGQKYRYRIDVGYGDINPPLVHAVGLV